MQIVTILEKSYIPSTLTQETWNAGVAHLKII